MSGRRGHETSDREGLWRAKRARGDSLAHVDPRTVALITMGCARNEVDSEELAGRLDDAGFGLVDDPEDADVVVVNTCGFVESAKQDSVDALLAAADLKTGRSGGPQAVVAVGCLAERYGKGLAEALPEADAVLSFDDYPDIAARLRDVLDGRSHAPHVPRDRRSLLPISPTARPSTQGIVPPGHAVPDLPAGIAPASGPRPVRRRLGTSPVAPVKLASGCDRRCSFCAIPAFRGAFLSRPPAEILGEAAWLGAQGVRELFLVSENTTSYGKDLGDLRLLEGLLPQLAAVDGILRVRVSYLQPAELRPGLVDSLAGTPGVAPYFDLSFQHASGPVLRRMRRFGDADSFLALLEMVRSASPQAGVRSNIIVGFPGETEADVAELERFLGAARLDVIGVFGYSDEDGTEAETLDGKLPAGEIAARVRRIQDLVDHLTTDRALERLGEDVEVLVESIETGDDGLLVVEGRGAHQGPEVDGSITLRGLPSLVGVGDLVSARVVDADGADLVAEPIGAARVAGRVAALR